MLLPAWLIRDRTQHLAQAPAASSFPALHDAGCGTQAPREVAGCSSTASMLCLQSLAVSAHLRGGVRCHVIIRRLHHAKVLLRHVTVGQGFRCAGDLMSMGTAEAAHPPQPPPQVTSVFEDAQQGSQPQSSPAAGILSSLATSLPANDPFAGTPRCSVSPAVWLPAESASGLQLVQAMQMPWTNSVHPSLAAAACWSDQEVSLLRHFGGTPCQQHL